MKPRYSDWALLKRIAGEARPYWPQLAAVLLASLLSIPVAMLAPLPLKIVIDSEFGSLPLPRYVAAFWPAANYSNPALVLAPCLMVLVIVLTYLQGSGGWFLQTYVGEKIALGFRAKLFAHVQRLSLAHHDQEGTASSTFRIQYDSTAIQTILLGGLLPLLTSGSRLAFMVWVTWRLDAQLALVALAAAPVLSWLTYVFGRRLRGRWMGERELNSSANSLVQEVLGATRIVRAFGRERQEHARYMDWSMRRMRELLRVALLQGTFDILLGTTIGVGMAAALYLGVLHVRRGVLTLGDLTLVMAYVMQLLDPLKAISKQLADLQGGFASAERAFSLLDQSSDVIEQPGALYLNRAQGNIRFKNVSFRYSGKRTVLSDVSLYIPAGARVGIRGSTGSGKSTLLNLLARFYDVSEGTILLDGIDIRDYRLSDLRNQYAIVPQDAVLFSRSIAENIGYGRPGAAMREIEEAAKLAQAHEFIQTLKHGYDTVVGERGMQLSGGERQRIAIARAFLKDAPVLLLDEPTSALDSRTERSVMEALERLMHGRTTFMIAHRLSTLETCDTILEVHGGRVTDHPFESKVVWSRAQRNHEAQPAANISEQAGWISN